MSYAKSGYYGGVGYENQNTPVCTYDQAGKAVFPLPPNAQQAHNFVVKSRKRRVGSFASQHTFSLSLGSTLDNVFAMEIVRANLPNVDAAEPEDGEIMICTALMDSDGYFNSQNKVSGQLYQDTLRHDADNPDGTSANADAQAFEDSCLLRYAYDSTRPRQYWSNLAYRRMRFFKTPVNKLKTLEFTVIDPTGVPYDFPADKEWTAELVIYCKN